MSDGEDNVETQLQALQERAPVTPEVVDGAPEGDGTADEIVVPGEPKKAEPETEQKVEPVKAPLLPDELATRHEQVKAALREERAQRRAEVARMEKAFEEVQRRLQSPPPAPAPVIDPYNYDPVQILWEERQNQVAWENQRHAQQQREVQARAAADKEFATIQTAMSEFEADFREATPDYDEAVGHMTSTWDATFEAMGYNPQTRAEMILQLSVAAVKTAIAANRDPALAIYEAAQRVGYAKKAPVQQQANGAEKIAQIAAGQAASKTLSGGGSGVQGEGLTLKQLASLEGAAFDAAMDKLRRNAR